MNNWQLLKAIFHGIDFYWKKLLVTSAVIIVVAAGIVLWQRQSISSASFEFSNQPNYGTLGSQTMSIKVTSDGQVIVDGKNNPQALKIFPNYYEIRVLAFDNPGLYIDSFKAEMSLPQPAAANQVEQLTYAVHGVGSYENNQPDNQTLVYTATGISSESTLTLVAHLPKNMLTPPLSKRILYTISSVSAKSYLILAFILPLVTFMVTLFMLVKRRKDQIISLNVDPINGPPDDLPPAVAGVLIDGQVGAREIAATLIDLANRGYIYINQRNDYYFSFGKRKGMAIEEMAGLRPFEQILLTKIFEPGNFRSTKDDVEMRIGRHIFSRKIAHVFLEIYDEATRAGYFVTNPAAIHRRWRYAGIALFFLGILGFFQSAFYAPDPKFTLFFWVGEMAAASVIVNISALMPARSARGSQALTAWMGFRKYLKLKRRIEPGAVLVDKFNKYLPYAIVFGVEAEWARRFMDTSFAKPEWYESIDYITSLEKYVSNLYPLISFVGTILAKSHEPTVE